MGKEKIGLIEAISIGIGGMVGGGIFAVLGLAVELSGGGTPVSFLIAGLIALMTSYSYAKLSIKYPDKGGTVRFINEGFGVGIWSGGINNLLWISYIIMLSLYASAFGSYAVNLFSISGNKIIDVHLFTSLVVVIATIINYYSIKAVGEIESYAVILKLIILLTFVVLGFYGLVGNENLFQLNPLHWESPVKLVVGGMVIFVAYEGFELIANAAPDIIDPEKNIHKAYLYSVVFVIILYIAIAFVTVGSLPFSEIAKAEDYVLAEAARPLLGKFGFGVITVAALISTFSAINATLYGGGGVSYEIAEDGEAPHELTKKLWSQPIGLLLTSVITLVVSNLLDLQSISTAGSAGFLFIFAVVNFVAFKRSIEIKSSKIITFFGAIFCAISMIALLGEQIKENIFGALTAMAIIVISFFLEWGYAVLKRRGTFVSK